MLNMSAEAGAGQVTLNRQGLTNWFSSGTYSDLPRYIVLNIKQCVLRLWLAYF